MEKENTIYKSSLSKEEIEKLRAKYKGTKNALYDPLIEEIKMLDHKIETSSTVPCIGFALFAMTLTGIGLGVILNTNRLNHNHIAGVLVAITGFCIFAFIPRFSVLIKNANREKYGPCIISLLNKLEERDKQV